jgi:ABC-type transport system involved in multi-copper enzyme maturation permease subunit
MYLWKCWQDTRGTFLTVLGALLATGAFIAYVAFDPLGWIAAKPFDLQLKWQFAAETLQGLSLGVLPVSGLVLGALGVGTEFERRTADFLLTRPRSRRYVLWVSWGMGAAQMVALVLVNNLLRLARVGSGRYRVDSLGDFFFPVAALSTLALVYYSLAYLMTTLARNGRNGIGLALAVMAGYTTLFLILREWYDTQIPFFVQLFARTFRPNADFPLSMVAGWLAVCLAMAVAAQFRFERAET